MKSKKTSAHPFVHFSSGDDMVAENLRVKDVRQEGTRYIICYNPQETERDQAERATMVAYLEEQLRRGVKAFMKNAAAKRYLKVQGEYNGPTKLDTKTARFKLHLRAWDGFGSSTHQVSRQRLFWNCSKKRAAYRSCRRSMGSILRNFTGGARRRWKSCRRFSSASLRHR